ncbi:MAG: glycosyltransferase [Chthoniobacterales bacterium]|nr:glycosyltransferase [Chthoniobacterales bacterium]
MAHPSLSIVIPAYNAGEFISSAVRSCLDVGRISQEIIVIDDGSTDETIELCSSFADKIRLVRLQNGGVSRARNTGAAMASGEWLLFLDADDRLEPDGPSVLLEAARDKQAGVAYGLVKEHRRPPMGARVTGQNYAEGIPPHPGLRNYWRCAVITPGSAVIRRELHQKIGGFVPGYEPMEDRDYWIKAGLLHSFAHIDRIVLDKTWRPVSAGKMEARRIWNGLRSRLALPKWCAVEGIPWPDELPRDEAALLEKAVNEAVWCKCWGLAGVLLRECRERKLRSFWILRAAAEFYLRGGARANPAPPWLLPLPA